MWIKNCCSKTATIWWVCNHEKWFSCPRTYVREGDGWWWYWAMLKYIGWQGIETVGGNNMRDCMAAGDYSSNSSYHNSVQRINNEQKSLVVIHETAWQTSVPLVHDNWANISPRKFKKTKIHKIKPQIKSAKINQNHGKLQHFLTCHHRCMPNIALTKASSTMCNVNFK